MKTAIMYMMALVSGLIWGITFSLARIATEANYHPLGLAWWQAAGGGSVMLVYCAARSEFSRHWPQFRHILTVALCGNVIPGTLLFYAAIYVPAGVLAITIAIVPLSTYAISVLMRMDNFSWRRFSGVLLGFAAIALIMLPGSFGGLKTDAPVSLLTDSRFWIVASLIAGINYTIENIYVDGRVPARTSIPLLLCTSMLTASVILLPLVLITGTFAKVSFPFNNAEWSIIAMMFVSAIAYLIYLMLIKLAGAVFASMSGYIVTLSGVLWGMLIFTESHSQAIWIALAAMLLGMALVTPRRQPETSGQVDTST